MEKIRTFSFGSASAAKLDVLIKKECSLIEFKCKYKLCNLPKSYLSCFLKRNLNLFICFHFLAYFNFSEFWRFFLLMWLSSTFGDSPVTLVHSRWLSSDSRALSVTLGDTRTLSVTLVRSRWLSCTFDGTRALSVTLVHSRWFSCTLGDSCTLSVTLVYSQLTLVHSRRLSGDSRVL